MYYIAGMKNWRREKDHYYLEAKKRGIRSRAYFKIEDMHKRFNIFAPGDTVIDIGAAPGGWLQYISKVIGLDGLVIGVDIREIEEFTDKYNIVTIKGDIFSEETLKKIKDKLMGRKADVIVSDASPNITGVYEIDSMKIYEINKRVMHIAKKFLKRNGILVLKTFQGREEQRVRRMLMKKFKFIKIYKPKASRKRSSEIYYIGFYFLPKSSRTPKTT